MGRIVAVFLGVIALIACDSDNQSFWLEGEFRNMNQAKLYIYDATHGDKDTIHVKRGRFSYDKDLTDTTTLVLIFPNYSTLPIFAYQGAHIKMKGDASQLKSTEIKGTDDNEDMTAFRLKASQQTPPEVKASAAEFIRQNPGSIICPYLLQTYFMQPVSTDYKEAYQLSRLMLKAHPTKPELLVLNKQLKELKAGVVGSRLPRFAVLDTKKKIITNQQFNADINVVCLWASWSYDSRNMLTQLTKLQHQHPKRIALLSICVDAIPTMQENVNWIKRDTIDCPIICDGKMWQTPLARHMGLTALPGNLIADKNGIIVKRDILRYADMKKEIEQMLK